jgi:hypothetical protein
MCSHHAAFLTFGVGLGVCMGVGFVVGLGVGFGIVGSGLQKHMNGTAPVPVMLSVRLVLKTPKTTFSIELRP